LRYGHAANYSIHVVDGGTLESGEKLVEHINAHYSETSYIDHIVCTHSDDDHTSGLRKVIEAFDVGSITMNRPWLYADEIIHLFHDQRMTVESLEQHLRDAYPILNEIEATAIERGIVINEAFQGMMIGDFTILAPSRDRYLSLIPELSRTPEAAKAESMSEGLLGILKKAIDWVTESWGVETLEEDVETSAANETSIVQMAELDGQKVLLNGDAGIISLNEAADYAEAVGLLTPLRFIQVPHHGSRHNVSPSILNRWIGDPVAEGEVRNVTAFASVAKGADTHPRKKVVNAFLRRGVKVYSTKGKVVRHSHSMPDRDGWTAATAHEFSSQVEE